VLERLDGASRCRVDGDVHRPLAVVAELDPDVEVPAGRDLLHHASASGAVPDAQHSTATPPSSEFAAGGAAAAATPVAEGGAPVTPAWTQSTTSPPALHVQRQTVKQMAIELTATTLLRAAREFRNQRGLFC
jgi:hypothetical protein